jgi:predicted metal-dependent hydrolase
MTNKIEGDGFSVNIIKSTRRKTMALKINHNGVSIHMPANASLSLATTFVHQKTAWILTKLKNQAIRPPITRQYTDGEQFLFLGEHCFLRFLQQEKSPTVNKIGNNLTFSGRITRLSTSTIKKTLIDWYKQQADLYLKSRTQMLAEKTELIPRSIISKTYKARWGSCKITGDIQFNWKLILAPVDVIDYVIVHELCHLAHHNHSASFWQLVAHHYPNFKQSRRWLKDNGYRLEI